LKFKKELAQMSNKSEPFIHDLSNVKLTSIVQNKTELSSTPFSTNLQKEETSTLQRKLSISLDSSDSDQEISEKRSNEVRSKNSTSDSINGHEKNSSTTTNESVIFII
jgi:hypothetical protein